MNITQRSFQTNALMSVSLEFLVREVNEIKKRGGGGIKQPVGRNKMIPGLITKCSRVVMQFTVSVICLYLKNEPSVLWLLLWLTARKWLHTAKAIGFCKTAATAVSFLISSAASASLALSPAAPGSFNGRRNNWLAGFVARRSLLIMDLRCLRLLTEISELIHRKIRRKSLMSTKAF